MRPLQGVRAVIFDMDGVLLLSSAAHEEAFRHVLAREYSVTDFDYKRYAGMRTDDCLRRVLDRNGREYTEKDIARLTKKKREMAFEYLCKRNPVHPEAQNVLSILLGKYPLALATSSSRRSMDHFLQNYEYGKYFRCAVHGSQVSQAKPAPEIYLKASACLDISPVRCVVVEDSSPGICAANSAGMTVVGVCGILRYEELRNAGAKAVISDLSELPLLLGVK